MNRLDTIALADGQSHTIESIRPLADIVQLFDEDDEAIGVMVTERGQFLTAFSREFVARFLSKPYTQFLFLRKPIAEMARAHGQAPLECSDDLDVSEVIALALARPASGRYEPIIARRSNGARRIVDVHSLLLQQNRILQGTLTSLEQQRAATLHAEREREVMHEQLLEASRDAGRAEVATGILHNVGNVLNSVSVSRAMISRKLEQSKVGNLGKALALFDEHRDDLAAFVSGDARGRQLPEYLGKLADALMSEHAFLRKEMHELGENLEHIKQVVATQQSYARVRTVAQEVRPADLMDDAARMNILSFERHNIIVERDYQDSGPLLMDRHKVLQILVNLISNAKNAVKRASATERRIVLRVGYAPSGRDGSMRFVVEDNGVGIAPEHLTRVFSHGFTTRKDGHGFGLHTSANFAREMGGSLAVESEGHGQGARFTLELPIGHAAIRGAA